MRRGRSKDLVRTLATASVLVMANALAVGGCGEGKTGRPSPSTDVTTVRSAVTTRAPTLVVAVHVSGYTTAIWT